MDSQENRWTLPDWESTLKWCKERNKQGIRCTVDVLGEYTKNKEEVSQNVESCISIVKAIKEEELKASLAVKLTAIGAIFDKDLCQVNLGKVMEEAVKHEVDVEIDMEGAPLVDYTLQTASSFSKKGFQFTLALQAYLNRTPNGLNKLLEEGIKVRLVKGAYKGDIEDFSEIQKHFKSIFEALLKSKKEFYVGTHDSELIEWMKDKASKKKDQIEFGFLKGLSNNTKIELAREGWPVSGYVPFGSERKAYETRRLRYLKELKALGKSPAI